MIDRKKYFNLTELKERGWTDSIIKKLLSDVPVIFFNGLYKNRLQRCYLIETIENIEYSNEFEELLKKSKIRKQKAEEISKKRLEEFESHLKNIKVTIKPLDSIWKGAYMSKMNWYSATEQIDQFSNISDIDEKTKNRWCVNYIRHNKTKYDQYLDEIFHKRNHQELYETLKKYTLQKIKEAYPELAEECDNQMEIV